MIKWSTKNIYLDNFLFGILAGLAIGVGGFLNLLLLSQGLRYLGGICFSVGLFSVCFFSLHLFTGKVGYVLENKKSYYLSLLLMYIGNIIGAVGFGYLMYLTGISTSEILKDTAINVANNKIFAFGENWYQSLLKIAIYSFFCGIMVFLAVDVFKKAKSFIVKLFNLIVCVALFVITGMEHCIANMFYFAISNIYASEIGAALLAIAIATIGNSVGAILSYIVVKNVNKKSETK